MRRGDIVLLPESPALLPGSFGLIEDDSDSIMVVLVSRYIMGIYYERELKRICKL